MTTAYDRAFDHLDPGRFRIAALYGCACILAFNKLIGASWLGTFVSFCTILAICGILPVREPHNPLWRKILVLISRIHNASPRWTLAGYVLLIAAVVGVQYLIGGFRPGRGLNFFLFPVFASSLLFGLRSGLIAWPFTVLVAYYCVIPPHYSLRIDSMDSFADLVIFGYESVVAAVVGVIIYESSASSRSTKEMT